MVEQSATVSKDHESHLSSKYEDQCQQNGDDLPQEPPKERRRRLLKQGFKMFLCSLGMWSMGSMFSFPSVVAHDLSQHNTTIFGNPISLTETQMDMLGSILTLCTIPGAWIIAFLMIKIGRRPSMFISGGLLILGWVGVIVLPGISGLLAARAVCGLAAGAVSVVINTYGIETPDADVRGIMFVILNNGIIAGQVVTMAVGYNARYYTVALVNLVLPVVFVISLIWLPESPSYLVIKGRAESARAVLLNLRGRYANVDAEIEGYESLNKTSKGGSSTWREFLSAKVLKSMAIVCTLFIFMYFSGYLVVSFNASRIFAEAGSTIDDNLAAIIVTVVQLMAGVVSSFLIDRLGRRKSLILSYSVMCVPLAILAAYVGVVDVEEGGAHMYGWIPLVCLMVSQAGVVLGVNPVPFIVSNEYFPTSIRSQASSICYTVGTITGVAVLQLYTPMREGMTQTGLYAFYSGVCAVGIPFSYFFVKETMGEQVG